MKTSLVFINMLVFVGSWQAQAQSVDSRPPRYSAPRFARLDFENDVLQLRKNDTRDGNFTNGVRLDLMGNVWKRLPTRFFLLEFPKSKTSKPEDFDYLYTFSLGQEMYTPRDIKVSSIQYQDRPYAGWLYVSSGLMTVDVVRSRKITSSFSIGVMGPYSFAAETQAFVHREISKSPNPEGWGNQVRGALGLSYTVRYEARPFPQLHRAFDIFGLLEGNAGTITNYVGGGFTLRIGQFDNYFQNAVGLYDPRAKVDEEESQRLFSNVQERHDLMVEQGKTPSSHIVVNQSTNRRFQLYFFIRPVARIMLDNSFLQGGWRFRGDNPYTLAAEDITHFFVNVEYGGVMAIKRLQLSYTQSFRTKEFSFGDQQQWGKVSLMFGLKYKDEKQSRQVY